MVHAQSHFQAKSVASAGGMGVGGDVAGAGLLVRNI